ncbi:MAG: hypothetical protein IT291_01095 [Deltaproteobacteria bacterium]|nr:hypothetical protein [Deltaproteobacteria bacterium]
MSELAYKTQDDCCFYSVSSKVGRASCAALPMTASSFIPSRDVLALGSFLVVLQALDAILTGMGVARFGSSIEGNPLLRSLMDEVGTVSALAYAKILAIVVVVTLTLITAKVPWVKRALGAISAVYVFGAILPWTYILFIKA